MQQLSDFRNFLYLVWKHLNLPDPTPVQYDIAEYLQHGPKRCMVQAFRGVGKSWVTSAFVCWVLLMDPQKNILVVSASKERADAFSTFTKRLINEMPILYHLRARPGQRDSNVAFDVGPARASHSPSVKSVGINGQIAGSRADIIIPDDIEIPSNSWTQAMRDKLAEQIKEFDAVLKPLDTSRIIYLGTPQTEMSVYNLLPKRDYDVRIWPARVPENPDKYDGRLSPYIQALIENNAKAGDPVDPKRFDNEDLLEREASYGRAGFALQFMLDTTLSDADRYPLKIADLLVMHLDPRMGPVQTVWSNAPDHTINDLPNLAMTGDRFFRPAWLSDKMTEYTGSVLAIDPSGRGADETGYAVVKILHGNLYVVAAGGFSDGYSEATLRSLAAVAKEHQVNYVIVEANFGDGMFTQILKPVFNKVWPVTIEEVKHSVQKERRIADVLEPVMNQHRLVFDYKVIKKDYDSAPVDPTSGQKEKSLIYQMTRLTRTRGALKHDDRLDALSIAVGYWVEHMARDVDSAVKDHEERLLEEELMNFADRTFNVGRKAGRQMGLRWY